MLMHSMNDIKLPLRTPKIWEPTHLLTNTFLTFGLSEPANVPLSSVAEVRHSIDWSMYSADCLLHQLLTAPIYPDFLCSRGGISCLRSRNVAEYHPL